MILKLSGTGLSTFHRQCKVFQPNKIKSLAHLFYLVFEVSSRHVSHMYVIRCQCFPVASERGAGRNGKG